MVNDRIGEMQYRHYQLTQYDWETNKRVPATRGGVTVAFQFLSPRVVDVGLALCSPEDNFNKAEGRDLARASLDDPGYLSFVQSFDGDSITEDSFELVILEYLANLAVQRRRMKRLLPRVDFIAWEQRSSIPRWLGCFVRKRLELILTNSTVGKRWGNRTSMSLERAAGLYENAVRAGIA